MCVKASRFANVCSQIKHIRVIFSHLELWIAVARHNFKWVKIKKNLAVLSRDKRHISVYIIPISYEIALKSDRNESGTIQWQRRDSNSKYST